MVTLEGLHPVDRHEKEGNLFLAPLVATKAILDLAEKLEAGYGFASRVVAGAHD